MATIPASAIVSVIPNVLSAGGNALVLNGVFLTQSIRVPIGTVQQFPSPLAVSNFFGPASRELALANIYFSGFDSSTQKPATMLFAQFPSGGVPAYLRSGNVSTLTIAQLQALSGSLTVIMDGYARVAASINLSGATSFSAAAALIATGLNTTPAAGAGMTSAIAPGTPGVVTASIAGNIMTVTAVTSGVLMVGAVLTGTGVTAGTTITSQLSGVTGGVGTYAVSVAQTVTSTAVTGTFGTLTVTVVSSGTLSVGQTVAGAGVTAATVITALGTGTGLLGTYIVNFTQTVASEAMTTTSTPLTVAYDSIAGAFLITSGVTGAASLSAFATGTLAASLLLTSATGAVLSQGAAASTPAAFMAALTQITQNWASFMTVFDPDAGVGNVQKQAFAAWVTTTQARYVYICWDLDLSPTATVPATSSLGYILAQANSVGTSLIFDPTGNIAAFVCGSIASLDFKATNGRATFAFRSQAGLVATVSSQAIAANLISNGYNFYGAYATANQNFVFFYPGSVSGAWQWLDSYVNQIWLNNQFQLAFMNLLVAVLSIPYNVAGYALIEAAAMDPINQGLNFGAFRAGVTLSSLQAAAVNNAAGRKISDTLNQRGWYFQVVDAPPQVRQARLSPSCNFWYTDGESVQQIVLNSVDVQ